MTQSDHVPDILNGTECGRLPSQPNLTLIGRRIVHEEHFGTVCYVGPLPNASGIWLGVDWDSPERGRHDGSFKGTRYFQTRTPTSGSFVRPEKVSLGTSLEEALVFRYVLCAECQLSSHKWQSPSASPDELEGSAASSPIKIELFSRSNESHTHSSNADPRPHSLCGPRGAESALKKLSAATFTLVPIFRSLLGPPINETAPLWPLPGGNLGQLLPSLRELDLSGCLLTRWVELAEICVQLPQLRALNVSNNRLRLPLDAPIDQQADRLVWDLDSHPSIHELLFARAFPSICDLILIRCTLLDWTGLERILSWMPSLKSLSVAYNPLGTFPAAPSDLVPQRLRCLVELDLTETQLVDLQSLFSALGPSTLLVTLLLNQNPIPSLPDFPVQDGYQVSDAFAPTSWFTHLSMLGLRRTLLADWKPFSALMRLPKLEHLLFWDCPVTDSLSPETARQEIIARLPSLAILNRMPIHPDERRGAELDYLKRYGGVWREMGGVQHHETAIHGPPEFAALHPVFARLCEKHGVPGSEESKVITRSLKEGLTSVQFVLQPSSTPVIRNLPGRMTIGHLRTLIRRLFKLAPGVSFDLAVQGERHKKIDTELLLDADTRELGFYCLEDGDTVFVRVHQ